LLRSTAHSTHNSQNVVVHRVDADLGTQRRANGVVGQGDVQGRIVNTGEVAGAAGLVLLGLERKGVHVDTDSGDVGVVLVRLDQVEVLAFTLVKSVMAVELDLGRHDRVVARQALHTGHGVARLQHGAIPPIGVVVALLALVGVDGGIRAVNKRITLNNPHELLARVVEVHLDLVGRGGHRLTAGELQLLNQVLVRDLGEAAALIRVQVDVVNIQGRRDQARGADTVTDGVQVRAASGGVIKAQVGELLKLQPDLDLVVLEGNQGQRKTRVAAEPELQRNVQSVLRGARGNLVEGVGLRVVRAGSVAALATLDEQVDELRHVANHLGITGLLARLLGELVPDVEPVTIVLVNLLATNLNIHVVDQVVTDPVEPAELGARAIRGRKGHLGESGLEVDTVDQVTITGDGALDLLAKVGSAREGLLNGLHGKVGVATVDDLEDKVYPPFREIYWSPYIALHQCTEHRLTVSSHSEGLDYNLSRRTYGSPLTPPFCF